MLIIRLTTLTNLNAVCFSPNDTSAQSASLSTRITFPNGRNRNPSLSTFLISSSPRLLLVKDQYLTTDVTFGRLSYRICWCNNKKTACSSNERIIFNGTQNNIQVRSTTQCRVKNQFPLVALSRCEAFDSSSTRETRFRDTKKAFSSVKRTEDKYCSSFRAGGVRQWSRVGMSKPLLRTL